MINYYNPVRLISTQNLSETVLTMLDEKSKMLVLINRSLFELNTLRNIVKKFPGRKICGIEIIDQMTDKSKLEEIARKYVNADIDFILGIGGGSVLDAAKVIKSLISYPEDTDIDQIILNQHNLKWNREIKLVAVPSTAGTGSEVTPFATIWDFEKKMKLSIDSEYLFPHTAIYNPELIFLAPPKVQKYSALDSLSHALESFWNINSNSMTQILAKDSLEIHRKYLLPYIEMPGKNLTMKIQLASLLSGLAISKTRTAIAHAISYPITAYLKIPHGLACSFTLAALIDTVIDKFSKSDQELLSDIRVIIGQLNLKHEILKFAKAQDIMAVIENILESNRAKNFIQETDSEFVTSIIRSSIS